MLSCKVHFSRTVLGVAFEVGMIEIRRARDLLRAQRAAEVRFARRKGLLSWRQLADAIEVECGSDEMAA